MAKIATRRKRVSPPARLIVVPSDTVMIEFNRRLDRLEVLLRALGGLVLSGGVDYRLSELRVLDALDPRATETDERIIANARREFGRRRKR